MAADNPYLHTREFVKTFGDQTVAELRNSLISHGKVASGRLLQSIGWKAHEEPGFFGISYMWLPYGRNVNDGRRAGAPPPPLSAIQDWCRIRRIDIEAAYPIARAIGRRGQPATYWYTQIIEKNRKRFHDGVAKGIREDLVVGLMNELKTLPNIKTTKN